MTNKTANKMTYRRWFLPALAAFIFLPIVSLSSWDWGLLLDQTAGIESAPTAAEGFSYSGTLMPWYSTPLGETGKLYLSAGATMEYENESSFFVPQLLRTELSFRLGEGSELKAGRMLYTDPLGFIANGLFDGARFSLGLGDKGALGMGIWYTGLLYKRNAQITMTGEEYNSYSEALDYSDFTGSYFAPRRLVAALDWDNPYMSDSLRFKTALLSQFDFSGSENLYHSQYLAAKISVPKGNFMFDIGACLELAEISAEDTANEIKLGLAGELAAGWVTPSPIRDRLMLTCRLSNGTAEDGALYAFVPITTENQGDIIKAKLSGLSMIRLDYTARLNTNFLFSLADSYFILSDLASYRGLPEGRDGHLLGNEICGKLMWSPVSDLRFDLGAGVFLPVMGNADKNSDAIWRVELNLIAMIF